MSSALTKMVGIPALIMVAFKVPTPGTSSSSTRLPVGNMAPSPSAGSINSICTSAAAAQELGRSGPAAPTARNHVEQSQGAHGASGNGQLAPVQEVLYFGRVPVP